MLLSNPHRSLQARDAQASGGGSCLPQFSAAHLNVCLRSVVHATTVHGVAKQAQIQYGGIVTITVWTTSELCWYHFWETVSVPRGRLRVGYQRDAGSGKFRVALV